MFQNKLKNVKLFTNDERKRVPLVIKLTAKKRKLQIFVRPPTHTQPTFKKKSLMVLTPDSGAMNFTNFLNGFYSLIINLSFVTYHRNASSQTQLAL